MKVNEMVMVIDNHKGIEKNFLCSFESLVKNYMSNACENFWEVAEMVTELENTKDEDNAFCEMYFAPNKTMYARFCSGVNELGLFIAGKLNDGMTNVFEENFCDKECLDVLYRLGISTDRSMESSKWPQYEKLEFDFTQGEIYNNFNGSDYRLMEKYSGRNMLFMDVHTGQFVVGVGVDCFVRYPKGEDRNSSLSEIGIEWGSGIYLGNTPSIINFSLLRKEYGIEKTIDTIDEYRAFLNEKFETYYGLAKNESISDSVREAATNAMYWYMAACEQILKGVNFQEYMKYLIFMVVCALALIAVSSIYSKFSHEK